MSCQGLKVMSGSLIILLPALVNTLDFEMPDEPISYHPEVDSSPVPTDHPPSPKYGSDPLKEPEAGYAEFY